MYVYTYTYIDIDTKVLIVLIEIVKKLKQCKYSTKEDGARELCYTPIKNTTSHWKSWCKTVFPMYKFSDWYVEYFVCTKTIYNALRNGVFL